MISLLEGKLIKVFKYRDSLFFAPTNSKVDGRLSLMYLCNKHVIIAELRYDNS